MVLASHSLCLVFSLLASLDVHSWTVCAFCGHGGEILALTIYWFVSMGYSYAVSDGILIGLVSNIVMFNYQV